MAPPLLELLLDVEVPPELLDVEVPPELLDVEVPPELLDVEVPDGAGLLPASPFDVGAGAGAGSGVAAPADDGGSVGSTSDASSAAEPWAHATTRSTDEPSTASARIERNVMTDLSVSGSYAVLRRAQDEDGAATVTIR